MMSCFERQAVAAEEHPVNISGDFQRTFTTTESRASASESAVANLNHSPDAPRGTGCPLWGAWKSSP